MKKIYLLIFLIPNLILAQTVATSLQVQDTRGTISPPSAYQNEVRAEFKQRDVLGVPGEGMYSGNLTIAPWVDGSGNKNHQLNFNDGGMFYRNGLPEGQWNSWNEIVTKDIDGKLMMGDFISTGSNSWMFHTPDDGRTSLHIAPKSSDGGFDWVKSLILDKGDMALYGKFEAREVKVTLSPTADFVFAEDYNLPKLEEVEKHIKDKKHLPEIASAKEMEKEGVNIGEFQIKLLQKIEELTLYTITQNKQLKEQSDKVQTLEKENSELKRLIERVEKLEKSIDNIK